MTRNLLLVGAGIMGRGYVLAAGELDLRVTLVDRAAMREGYVDLVDEFIESPETSEETWLSTAWAAAQRRTPDAVLAFSERQVLAAAWVQDALGLPGPSLRAAQASRNKGIQRVLLEQAGVGQPAFRLTNSPEAAAAWSAGRFPVVVKSLRGSASDGVELAVDAPALKAVVAARAGETVLVEEYVAAPEFSWEGLVEDGRIMFGNFTLKSTSQAPQFVETGHLLPAVLDEEVQAHLLDGIRRVIAVLNVRTSLVHLEFRTDGQRMWMMETAVRTPGDHLMELLGLAYHRNLYADVVRLAAGLHLPPFDPDATPAAIRYLVCPPGRIDAVSGLEDAAKLPGVVRVQLDHGPGRSVGPLRSSDDRVGYVIAAGPAADAVAVKASESVVFSVSSDDDPLTYTPSQESGNQ